ncbi:MAG: hypothetical protein LKF70_01110 [Prevotella sp.]|jgi:hypothetical protein|nr:hypothetical protein [Prevotella sp.]MCH4240449.1 hypothetical protein [Prevotella sp.]
MRTINDIVIFCFEKAKYHVQNINSYQLAYFDDENKHDYWIIANEFDLDKQEGLLEEVKGIVNDASFLKNISILFVKHQGQVNLSEADDEIIEIENDPYFFKKYVLSYTDDSVNGLLDLLNRERVGKTMSDILMEDDNFQQMKDENEFGTYHLLYSLGHKLPFLTMSVTPKDFDAIANFNINNDNDKQLLKEIDSITDDNNEVLMKSLIEKEN